MSDSSNSVLFDLFGTANANSLFDRLLLIMATVLTTYRVRIHRDSVHWNGKKSEIYLEKIRSK